MADLFQDWPMKWKWQVYPSAPKEAFRKTSQKEKFNLISTHISVFSSSTLFYQKLLCIKLTADLSAPPLFLSTATSIPLIPRPVNSITKKICFHVETKQESTTHFLHFLSHTNSTCRPLKCKRQNNYPNQTCTWPLTFSISVTRTAEQSVSKSHNRCKRFL